MELDSKILNNLLKKNKSDIFLIHPDLFRLSVLTKNLRILDSEAKRNFYLKSNIDHLYNILDKRDMWFPAFNFDFLKKGIFDKENSICNRGGPLSEYFRKFESSWRTLDPVFSITGSGTNPFPTFPTNKITAYDENSFFSELINKNGSIFCYGAKPSTLSHIHFIEKLCNVPYRYNKQFKGLIITDNKEYNTTYQYFVRPSPSLEEYKHYKLAIEYDWKKIIRLIYDNNIIETSEDGLGHIIKAGEFVDLLSRKISSDSLYLLEKNSHNWISNKLEKLGRAFNIGDFEQF